MSIGIYSFLRIYFLSFGLSAFAQFRTHCAGSPVPAAGTICPARRGLFCIWRGLSCCLYCAVRPGALGLGSPLAGYIAAALPRPVSLSTSEKIKKTHPTFTNQNPSDCASLQKFQKIQKDPFRSLDCGIIS